MKTIVMSEIPDSVNFISDLESADNFEKITNQVLINEYRPESSTHRPIVKVNAGYNRSGIYLLYNVADRYVICRNSQPQSNVFEDSCVEFFVQPHGRKEYFNFEFNCIGTILSWFISDPKKEANGNISSYIKLSAEDLTKIVTVSSIKELITEENKEELNWSLRVFIPFEIFKKYCGSEELNVTKPWRCNFYKCADGSSHVHWGAWNEVSRLNFHNPADFGAMEFGNKKEAVSKVLK